MIANGGVTARPYRTKIVHFTDSCGNPVLRISKLTDYATVILASLAADSLRQRTAQEIAQTIHLAAPTVAKLLKQLHRAGLVESTRGLHGGYRLARPAQTITAAAILDALEGPLALTECATGHSQCDLQASCSVGGSWQRINQAIRQSLEEITLAELAGLESNPRQFAVFDVKLRNGVVAGVNR
jgi:FeS assembly SUF system regulator